MPRAEPGALELARQVRAGQRRSADLVDRALDRIRALEPELNAFITVLDGPARAAADSIDARCRAGDDPGPLAGVPVVVKDNICTAGVRTTCGSRVLERYVPPYDATAVARLRAAGAVIVGKTNLDEFAMGSSGENSAFGPTRNPWDGERVPGGSSSGSAAAVAARGVPLALGSDTGGSVRQPGALCGVVAVKPTYGRVSRYGLVAFASSLDQIGTLARSVADARALLQAIAGHDDRDSTSQPEADAWRPSTAGAAPRLGVPRALMGSPDADVSRIVGQAIERYRALGAAIEAVELASPDHALAAYYILAGAEASSNLARYDGVRYGSRQGGAGGVASAEDGDRLRDMVEATRSAGLGAEVKRRIMTGTYVLSSGYYEAYYVLAQRARTVVRRALEAALQGVDAILMPTSPTVAFRRGERTQDPVAMYLSDVFTIPVNMAGLPAISIPAGFGTAGLPVGVQLIGRHWEEETLFDLAARFEAAVAGELDRRPPVLGRLAGGAGAGEADR